MTTHTAYPMEFGDLTIAELEDVERDSAPRDTRQRNDKIDRTNCPGCGGKMLHCRECGRCSHSLAERGLCQRCDLPF